MTSWIRAPLRKKSEPERPLFFATEDATPAAGGFAGQFNSYLYAALYARRAGAPLHVFDRSNAISANYPLLASTFRDVSGIQFETSQIPSATLLSRTSNRLTTFLNSQTFSSLRAGAAEFLQWNSTTRSEIQSLRSHPGFPASFDAGIFLGKVQPTPGLSLGARPVSVGTYLEALRGLSKDLEKPDLTVFVASETPALLQEFKQKADPAWNVVTLFPTNVLVSAYDPTTFVRTSQTTRITALREMITELSVLQSVPVLFTVLSNPIGKFLLLTCKDVDGFKSLDTQRFSAY